MPYDGYIALHASRHSYYTWNERGKRKKRKWKGSFQIHDFFVISRAEIQAKRTLVEILVGKNVQLFRHTPLFSSTCILHTDLLWNPFLRCSAHILCPYIFTTEPTWLRNGITLFYIKFFFTYFCCAGKKCATCITYICTVTTLVILWRWFRQRNFSIFLYYLS